MRGRFGVATVAATLAVVVAHLWLSARLAGPSLLWDGTAYLSVSRWLAGEATPYLGHLMHYSAGYSLVLVPVVWLTSSLDGLYDGVRVVNAVAAGSTVPALVVLTTRLTSLERWPALAFSTAAVLTPAIAVQTGFEWAESVLFAAVVWSAVAALRWVDRPSAGRAVALAAASGVAYVVHPRALAVAVASAIVLVGTRRRSIAGLAVLVVVAGAGELLNRHAVSQLWNPAVDDQSAAILETVLEPSRWTSAAMRGAGQVWYALLATAGLAAIGFGALVRRVRDRDVLAGWTVLAVTGSAGLSVAKLATHSRPDQLVYGRYLDPWLPLLAVVGAGAFVAGAARRRGAWLIACGGATAALTGLLVAVHGTGAFEGVFMPLNLLGALVFDASHDGRIDVAAMGARGTVAVVVVLLALALVRRRAVAVGGALCVLALAASSLVSGSAVVPFSDDANQSFVLAEELDRVDRQAPVSYDMRVFDARGTNRYALVDRDRRFVFYDPRRGERPAHDLIVSGKDVTRPPVAGARPVFPEPKREQTLWVAPGALQDDLAARGFLIAAPGDDPGPAFGNGRVDIVGARGGGVEVRLRKDEGGAPWLAPASLPLSAGAVTVVVTIDGRSWRRPLPRTLLPGDELSVTVPVTVTAGRHEVRARLVSDVRAAMPDDTDRLRFP